MTTEKQVAANQQNAQHSTGPRDTRRTRRNARKHGLLGQLNTQKEREQRAELAIRLAQHYQPYGPTEAWFVGELAGHMLRIERAVQAEGAYITQRIQQNTLTADAFSHMLAIQARALGKKEPLVVCTLTPADIEKLNSSLGRYETTLFNRYFRVLHELERLQRQRKGEYVPPPAAGDLGIHGDAAANTPSCPGPSSELSRPSPGDIEPESLELPAPSNN